MNNNDFFMRMCKEAQEELASGKKSWKDIDVNTLLLASFGMLMNHLYHKLSKPLWFFAGSVAVGVLVYIIQSIFLA